MLRGKNVRDESDERLEDLVKERRTKIYAERSQRLEGKSPKTHLIREMRKEVARILTVQRERELERKS